MSIKVAVYTPTLSIAKGLVSLLTSEGAETHLFTSASQCEEFLRSNRVDLLYICIRNPNEEVDISKRFKEASVAKDLSLLFHYADEKEEVKEKAAEVERKTKSIPAATRNTPFQPQDEKKEIKTGEKNEVQAEKQGVVEHTTDDKQKSIPPLPKKADKQIKCKILIAEDDVNIANILKFKLKSLGFAVTHAIDGQEALDMAYEIEPDLIMLDVMMPKYTGTEVARMLRLDERFQKTPILIITASPAEGIEKMALKGGADRFIRKPFQMDKLLSTVKNLLDSSEQTSESDDYKQN